MSEYKLINNIKAIDPTMSKKEGADAWDVLIILGATAIIAWAVLKALGVIHSPTWVEMVPYLGGGVSIIGGAYKLGKIKRGIEETERKVNKILVMEEKFGKLEHEHNLAIQGKLKVKH